MASDLGCKLPPEGWWCSRKPNHRGPCAARAKPKEKIVCPECGGKGYYFVKEFMGNDCYDEPSYYDSLYPCTTCRTTVRVKREGYL